MVDAWVLILLIIFIFTGITIAFYYKKDVYEPEPPSRIALAFIYGILSIIPAVIISVLLTLIMNVSGDTFLSVVFIAPIVEEICKAAFVVILAKHNSFDGPIDGLIYGAMVGAGFAAGENFLYGISFVESSGLYSGIGLTLFRSLSGIIGHPLYTGLTGIGIGEAKVGLTQNKYQQLWRAMLLHALWNGSSAIPDFGFFLGLAVVVVTSIIILRIEIAIVVELDKRAYESGYYTRKKQMMYQPMPPVYPQRFPQQPQQFQDSNQQGSSQDEEQEFK